MSVTNCFNGIYDDRYLGIGVVHQGFQIHFYTNPLLGFSRKVRLIFDKAGELVMVKLSHLIPIEAEKDFYVTGEQCLDAVKDFGSFKVTRLKFINKYDVESHPVASNAFRELFQLTCHPLSKALQNVDEKR